MWIKTTGWLAYEPHRPEFKKNHKVKTLIAELPRDDLDLYHQWFLKKRYGSWLQLQRPMWGKHLTIVRGDEKPDWTAWRRHEGRQVEIEYSMKVELNWAFWSLPVRTTQLLTDLRAELKLKALHDFHITIGRQHDWQKRSVA